MSENERSEGVHFHVKNGPRELRQVRRAELADDVRVAPPDVRDFVRDTFREWLVLDAFEDAIRANLPGDSAQDERLVFVRERFEQIALDS